MGSIKWIAVCFLLACGGSHVFASEDVDDHDDHHDEHDEHTDADHHDEHAEHTDADHHDEHDHDGHDEHGHKYPWEWSAIFQLSEGHYSWNAARKGGVYAAPSMQVLILRVDHRRLSEDSYLARSSAEAVESQAAETWGNTTWKQRASGKELLPGFAYNLLFDEHSWISVFPIDVEQPTTLAVFAQHAPSEFEDNFHFFKTEEGADVEPVAVGSGQVSLSDASASSTSEANNEWGMVILGSFITCTPTLLGILFVSCAVKPQLKQVLVKFEPSLDSFASGVLLAAAVFLLLPEALHLAGSGHDDEVSGTWTWGTSILLGWLTCVLIHHSCEIVFAGKELKGEPDLEKHNSSTLTGNWLGIAGPVIFGDFFHNFADGFVIGAAFKNCSTSFAWQIIGVSVAHELPQEIADFFLLINDAGMRWHTATLANFSCSLSTVLGALISYGSTVGENEQGYILAYGAGVYMFIAMTELGAKVVQLQQTESNDSTKSTPNVMAVVQRLVPFAVGCIVIGAVLLNHKHCSVSVVDASGAIAASINSHAGHNH